jgi:hypothetical protein
VRWYVVSINGSANAIVCTEQAYWLCGAADPCKPWRHAVVSTPCQSPPRRLPIGVDRSIPGTSGSRHKVAIRIDTVQEAAIVREFVQCPAPSTSHGVRLYADSLVWVIHRVLRTSELFDASRTSIRPFHSSIKLHLFVPLLTVDPLACYIANQRMVPCFPPASRTLVYYDLSTDRCPPWRHFQLYTMRT